MRSYAAFHESYGAVAVFGVGLSARRHERRTVLFIVAAAAGGMGQEARSTGSPSLMIVQTCEGSPSTVTSSLGSASRITMPEMAVAPPAPSVTMPEDAATQPAAPQIAPPIYAAPSDYSPAQPAGGAFRTIVLILLLVIVVGAFGGWYFWGVETVIVCSPPDVRVFLDDKELAPSSYGRYVVPHLSRQTHLLKVQRPGFADTLQRLDFPLNSTQEWVNIKLVPSRQLR